MMHKLKSFARGALQVAVRRSNPAKFKPAANRWRRAAIDAVAFLLIPLWIIAQLAAAIPAKILATSRVATTSASGVKDHVAWKKSVVYQHAHHNAVHASLVAFAVVGSQTSIDGNGCKSADSSEADLDHAARCANARYADSVHRVTP